MYFFISMNLLLYSLMFLMLSFLFMMNKFNLIIEWTFFYFFSNNFKFIIYLDWMTNLFLMTVLLISSMVILYSMEYMKLDMNINRFMNLIMIFVLSMIFMIICPNMLTILIGWDGLGISSYCLIIFYQNMKSINSSLVTILMNRIGDICIIIMFCLMINFKNLNFLFINNKMNFFMSLMILLCSITKSAQIPFSSWLPLAMAAPTPVSALVHSSTLVTAGIYLLIRFNKILNYNIIYFMMYLSMFTMFMSSMNAIFEYDLKKIIALSTLSQLALMMFILSFNLSKLSFFHLISHAMFKSLLFLCSGIMIHNSFNNQDIRFMNLFNFNMNFTKMIFNIASLSLCGLPFLSGFYSKDLIIEMFNMMNNNWFMFMILYISTFLTMLYSFRLIYFTSFNYPKMTMFFKNSINNLMIKSIMILLLMTIIFSSMINWLMYFNLNIIFLNKMNKLLIYLNFIILFPIMYLLFNMKFLKNIFMYNLMFLFNSSMLLNLMNKFFIKNFFKMNFNYIYIIDFGWNENLILIKLFTKLSTFYIILNKIKIMNLILLSLILLYYLMI